MIRDLYEGFLETKVCPKVEKENDPFWDPPLPIITGRAFVKLAALTMLQECNMKANIVPIEGQPG
jgi:hypothetical protein